MTKYSVHYKKDGTLDMRYKTSKKHIRRKRRGSLLRRFLWGAVIGAVVALYLITIVALYLITRRSRGRAMYITGSPLTVPTVKAMVTVTDISEEFAKYDWDSDLMLAICKSENGYEMYNGWKANAKYTGNSDGSTDTGLCMINSVHGYSNEVLSDPATNIRVAYDIWLNQGYEAWSDYNNGRYGRYL